MNILIVEDDLKVAANLTKGLSENEYEASAVHTAEDAVSVLDQTSPDLVVLDLGLPKRDGFHVLQHLRKAGKTMPVIILTARDGVQDRVAGLDEGADDYLVKPFAFAELLARIRALTRRTSLQPEMVLRIADLEIDLSKRRVIRGEEEIHLTQIEFDLLTFLARSCGEPVSREMLTREVWKVKARATPMDNIIDVHISHLRRKIDGEREDKLIHTLRGVGYVLKDID